jgi:hypothetical protein
VLVLAILTAACATAETVPSATVTTLDPAASRYFKLDWTAVPAGGDARVVDGYISSTYGEAARVQLLAQGLDASGQVVDQKIEYPIEPVPGFGRVYFHIGPLAAADHYQVTVWSAYFFQGRKPGP